MPELPPDGGPDPSEVEPTWNLYPAADPSEVAPADRSWLRTESIGPRWRMRVSGPLAPPAADKPTVPRPVVAYRCLQDGQKCGCCRPTEDQ